MLQKEDRQCICTASNARTESEFPSYTGGGSARNTILVMLLFVPVKKLKCQLPPILFLTGAENTSL